MSNRLEALAAMSRPQFFVTVRSQAHSAAVLEMVRRLENCPIVMIFDTEAEAASKDLSGTVVFFDSLIGAGHFRPFSAVGGLREMPAWARQVRWGVAVGARCSRSDHHAHCARNTVAMFYRGYEARREAGEMPWGPKRRSVRRRRKSGGRSLNKFYKLRAA